MDAFTSHTGVGVPLRRSNVDTDQIIPAVYLKRVTRTGFEDGLFAAWRNDPDFVLNRPEYAAGSVLVAGPDFGTGSSREHAVWALMDFGFRVVISSRFGDIFRGNSGKAGLLAAKVDEKVVQRLWDFLDDNPGGLITVDLDSRTVRAGDGVDAIEDSFDIDDYTRWRLLEGLDDIGITLGARRRHRRVRSAAAVVQAGHDDSPWPDRELRGVGLEAEPLRGPRRRRRWCRGCASVRSRARRTAYDAAAATELGAQPAPARVRRDEQRRRCAALPTSSREHRAAAVGANATTPGSSSASSKPDSSQSSASTSVAQRAQLATGRPRSRPPEPVPGPRRGSGARRGPISGESALVREGVPERPTACSVTAALAASDGDLVGLGARRCARRARRRRAMRRTNPRSHREVRAGAARSPFDHSASCAPKTSTPPLLDLASRAISHRSTLDRRT